MDDPKEVALKILGGFIGDPPDTEFQLGYLAAMLTFANEVLCIPNHAYPVDTQRRTDPLDVDASLLQRD